MHADPSPLALIGHSPAAARALRELGVVALSVPTDDLRATLEACATLHFSGALVHPSQELRVADVAQPDAVARQVGRVDAVAFAAGIHGTCALIDALSDTLEASGYATRGASALLLGHSAHDLALALPLMRLGFTDVGVAAETALEAERATRHLPAGLRAYPLSRRDSALTGLAERADLLVLSGGGLPSGLAQPYHTVVDLTGKLSSAPGGASLLDLSALGTHRAARQLLHATGQRFHADELREIARALSQDRSG
ncbi:shikimate dehydrogenase [Deinococcus aerophilus]|uniref:Shikimate dehydrogenase n=1 Tax=Deinococcus aerophilus TaxID=522488 RepID=A0ABQ2GLH2_9DEIO|nr:shikimate dehydrogenase [Deinococcus aerophilus]GGM01103.1 hypothetical protein GCM10010841_07100 [Deinococcus aerophilus]